MAVNSLGMLALLALSAVVVHQGAENLSLSFSGSNSTNISGRSNESGIGRSPVPPFFIDDQANFSDIAVFVFRPSAVKFTTNSEENWMNNWIKNSLSNMIFVNNKESLGDVFEKIWIMANPNSNAARATSLSNAPPETAKERQARGVTHKWSINQLGSNEDTSIKRRSNLEEKSLGMANCGPRTGKWLTFERKHIIDVSTNRDALSYGEISYTETVKRRISEALEAFTFFFRADGESIEYLYKESNDECYTRSKLITYTCHRFHNEDQVVVCMANGKCAPTYQKSTGHLAPLQCERDSALGLPDYKVTIGEMLRLQADYINQLNNVKSPPTKLDWALNAWRGRKWQAKNRGELFTEPKPFGIESPREKIRADYMRGYAAFRDQIPVEIFELFWAVPKLYVKPNDEARRDPRRPSCGVVSIEDVNLSVCVDHKDVDLSLAPYNWGAYPMPPLPNYYVPNEAEIEFVDELWSDMSEEMGNVIQTLRRDILPRNEEEEEQQQQP